jgi:hypothetical protein
MVLLVLLLFPDGQPLSPRWRPLVWVIVAGALVTMVAAALLPGIADTALPNPLGLAGRTGAMLEEQLQMLVTFGLPLVTVAASASLIVRFRQARGVQRQQLKWLAYAAGMVILTLVIQDSWLGGWGDAASNLALWAVPAAIGVAILRHRLYDVDRLINRTLVYGVLTALLGGVYVGTVLVLGQVFGGVGKDPPSWAVAGATLAVAALFQPARRRIQAVVDRRFNRRKYDAVRTVEAFSVRMRDEVDLDALSAELLAVVEQTIQPTRASLWLRPAPQAPPRGTGRKADQTPPRLDPCMPCSFGPLPHPTSEVVHPAHRTPRSDRDCPLDTARARCLWHVGGTAHKETMLRRASDGSQFNRRVRPVLGEPLVVGDEPERARGSRVGRLELHGGRLLHLRGL